MRLQRRLTRSLLLAILGSVVLGYVALAVFWLRWHGYPDVLLGRVADADGPVPSARVRIQGFSESVLTGAQGEFRLRRPANLSARVTAWKQGYFIAGVAADTIPLTIALRRLPADDCEQYDWVEANPDPGKRQNCGNCHGEIHREWLASGHSRSVNNRRFRNLYDGSDWHGQPNRGWNLLAEHPDGAGVCSACHAPTVSFTDPAYYDLRGVSGTAAGGVHCDFCHKIADSVNDQIGLTHGRFGLKLLRPKEGQLFFGPLDDVDRDEDSFAPIYRDSRYCASCHEGTLFGVHVYSTYSEWLLSPARKEGKQCQTCHMAPTGKLTNIASGKGGLERDPATLANHRFFQGSQLDMLRDCLKVSVRLIDREEEIGLEVEVRAERVGHRVPTGFVDRNLVLVVQATDSHSKELFPLPGAAILPAGVGKSLGGRAGRLYAKQLRDFDGRQPAPFWRAQPEMIDTRLHPEKPDLSAYRFPRGTAQIRLRLLYRPFWEELAKAKDWPDDEICIIEHILRVEPVHS